MGLFSFLTGKSSDGDASASVATPPEPAVPATAPSSATSSESTPFERPAAWDALPDIDTGALTAPIERANADGPSVGQMDLVRTAELQGPIVEVIKTVYDPEIPVDIYELGLIYDIVVDAERRVLVKMTLTSPACPSAQQLPSEVRYKVKAVPGVSDATVEVVWEPPWDKDRMSEAAKLQLGFF
jgi:FeS assembly SUF system protein